jgi:3-oxoacyl-[acyl-carrier-protein] synthase-1
MSVPFDRAGSICVVGVGAATSIGMTAPATAAAVRAGIAGFSDHPYMIDRIGEPFVVASAPYIDTYVDGEDRFIELALPAAREALEPVSGLMHLPIQNHPGKQLNPDPLH